jgi:transcriptional regulatory protein LevR
MTNLENLNEEVEEVLKMINRDHLLEICDSLFSYEEFKLDSENVDQELFMGLKLEAAFAISRFAEIYAKSLNEINQKFPKLWEKIVQENSELVSNGK